MPLRVSTLEGLYGINLPLTLCGLYGIRSNYGSVRSYGYDCVFSTSSLDLWFRLLILEDLVTMLDCDVWVFAIYEDQLIEVAGSRKNAQGPVNRLSSQLI